MVAGLDGTVIAARIGRDPSVVSCEVGRHGGRAGYRAVAAQRVATQHRARPKTRKIDASPLLRQQGGGHAADGLFAGAGGWPVA
ncbi:MAG: hypothetical protein ACRDT0_27275 [Pseudonocardiaceae bacterium]